MTTNTVASSDVETARALSRRLSGLEPGAEPEQTTDTPYLRFGPTDGAATPPTAEPEHGADEPLNDFTRWDEFLAWSLNTVRSSAAFVVDPQGFVIGTSGNVPEDGFEGTGAELSYVMSQADVLKTEMGSLESIHLRYRDHRVSGFRASGEAEGFLVAFIDAESFTPRSHEHVARQLAHSFSVLL
jgi:hypothetical protein